MSSFAELGELGAAAAEKSAQALDNIDNDGKPFNELEYFTV